jgi:ABC-type antimicrobial peptide transport system permease subunit
LDAASAALALLLMAVLVTAAASLPSFRATRVDPIDALREA